MKTQITSILLCALLGSTLGHEYLSARQFVHEARSSKHLSLFQARDAPTPQQCKWVCKDSNSSITTGGLQIVANETTNLVAVVNVTANVAFVIDINANLVALLNGTSGAAIVVNIQNGTGVYIEASVWLSSKESFEIYFKQLTSLTVILNIKGGKSFDASSISSVILEALGELLVHLAPQLKVLLQGKAALTILLKISSSLVAVLKGPLEGILKLLGGGLIHIAGDIVWLVGVLEGIGAFLKEVPGGLAALLKAKVELDLALLLGARTGIDLLANLLLAVGARLDLSIISGLLNSVEKLLNLIVQLGGNKSDGITGLLKVVANIVGLIEGSIKIDVLIKSLLEFVASTTGAIDISISIGGLREAIEVLPHSSEQLSGLKSLVDNLLNGKLVIGGINISEIIEILVKGVVGVVGGVLQLVVKVLLSLTSVVKAVVSIPTLLHSLLQLLNSVAGIELLQKVVTGLSINIDVSISGNIIGQIFSKVNIKTILSLLTSGSIEKLLKALPVVGQIVDALSSAVSAGSNGSLSLTDTLKSSEAKSIVIEITAWVKSSLNISGNVTLPPVTLPPITLPTLPGIGGSLGGSGGSNGSVSSSGHWGIGWGHGRGHGSHHGHEKSGHIHSHDNKLEEKKHHREH